LDQIADMMGRQTKNKSPMIAKIKHSSVVNYLKTIGYSTVAFTSGFYFTELKNFNRYLSCRRVLSEFQNILLATTPLPKIASKFVSQYQPHRNRLLFVLDKLPEVPDMGRPKFVFAHILAPHPPFVFDRNGEELDPEQPFCFVDGSHFMRRGGTAEEYISGYRDYVVWLNRALMKMINDLLANAESPPIIILQADHGPGSMLDWDDISRTNSRERFSILNAMYIPGTDHSTLYRSMSPVNTFRILFNQHFGTSYSVLADKCFLSSVDTPYDLTDVTGEVRIASQPTHHQSYQLSLSPINPQEQQ